MTVTKHPLECGSYRTQHQQKYCIGFDLYIKRSELGVSGVRCNFTSMGAHRKRDSIIVDREKYKAQVYRAGGAGWKHIGDEHLIITRFKLPWLAMRPQLASFGHLFSPKPTKFV